MQKFIIIGIHFTGGEWYTGSVFDYIKLLQILYWVIPNYFSIILEV